MGTDEERGESADERFAVNVRRWRERKSLSQDEVARLMTERGFPYHQQTVAKIENGARNVRIGEGVALGEILGVSVDYLTAPTKESRDAHSLTLLAEMTEKAYEEVKSAVAELLQHRARLSSITRLTLEYGSESEFLATYLDRAERILASRTAEIAIREVRKERERASNHKREDLSEDLTQLASLTGASPEQVAAIGEALKVSPKPQPRDE